MKKLAIDGTLVKTPDDFYTLLGKTVSLPAHFGRNLDALWDFLTTELTGELSISWPGKAEKKMADIKKLLAVAARENPKLTFIERE